MTNLNILHLCVNIHFKLFWTSIESKLAQGEVIKNRPQASENSQLSKEGKTWNKYSIHISFKSHLITPRQREEGIVLSLEISQSMQGMFGECRGRHPGRRRMVTLTSLLRALLRNMLNSSKLQVCRSLMARIWSPL